MGNTVHQVLVQAVRHRVAGTAYALALRCAALGVEYGCLAVGDLLDQLLRLMDAVIHAGKQHRLAVKAGGLNIFVRRNDDAVTGGNLLGRQNILCTVRAVGLDLGGQAQLIPCLGQGLGRHVGVGNAVGAGRHGQHAVAVLGDLLLGKALLAELGVLLCVNGIKEGGRCLGGAQLLNKILVHEHLHHTGQHVDVQAAVFRCGNRKQQVSLAVIVRIILHRLAQAQGRQTGPCDAGRAGMGHRDAVIHIGGCLGLAGIEGFFVGVLVGDVAVGRLQINELVDDGSLIRGCDIQRDGLRSEQFRNTHKTVLLQL